MKKLTTATLNMILALGVICVMAGILFFARISTQINAQIQNWTVVMTVIGAVIFYFSLTVFKFPVFFFLGLFDVLAGSFFMYASSGILKAGFAGLWPVSILIASVCLLLTGFARDRRVTTAFGIPSGALAFIGFFFLLFSLDVIKVSFRKFVSTWWPLIPVIVGITLVVIFFLQQNPVTKDYFPYDKDESDPEHLGSIERLSEKKEGE